MSEIVSFNLSWATQKNIVAGSEKNFVLKCHKHFGKKLVKDTGLPMCTNMGAEGIHKNTNFDIMGLQECVADVTPKFIEYLNNLKENDGKNEGKNDKKSGSKSDRKSDKKKSKRNSHYEYITTAVHHANLITVYRKSFGEAIIMKKGNLSHDKDLRPFHVIYFPKLKLLFANSHFPHGLLLKDYDEIFNKMFNFELGNKKVNRIIFAGDFNDGYGYLADRGYIDIKLNVGNGNGNDSGNRTKNFHLTCNNLKNVESCCYIFFSIPGDYIFDSESSNKLKIVKNFTKNINEAKENENKFVGSDHLPVISKTRKKLMI